MMATGCALLRSTGTGTACGLGESVGWGRSVWEQLQQPAVSGMYVANDLHLQAKHCFRHLHLPVYMCVLNGSHNGRPCWCCNIMGAGQPSVHFSAAARSLLFSEPFTTFALLWLPLQELRMAQQAEGALSVPAISGTSCSGMQMSEARHARKLLQGAGEGAHAARC